MNRFSSMGLAGLTFVMGMNQRAKLTRAVLAVVAFSGLILEARVPQKSGAGTAQAQSLSDFETYRTHIEPIFLKPRQDGVRCYDCHSKLVTRLRLEPLSPGTSSWTEEQSRRNFAAVSQLITPSEPLKSRLLLHPLAQEAGGDPYHTGGKFWASEDDPQWKMLADWVSHSVETNPAVQLPSHSVMAEALDFQFFKSRVQPVFLNER